MWTRSWTLDTWIRAGTAHLAPASAREIRQFNTGQLLGMLTSLAFAVFWFRISTTHIMAFLSFGWVLVAGACRVWVYRRPADLQAVIAATLGSGLALIFFACLFSGQSDSPFMVFLLTMPGLAAYRSGGRSAVLWTLVSIALIAVLFASRELTPVPKSGDLPRYMQALAWVSAAGLLCIFAVSQRNSWDMSRRELAVARDEALEAADQRMRFLNRMSHEIRTPLHGAIGMSEMLLRTELDASQQEAAAIVKRSATGLVEVVDRVLDLARLDADALELVQVEFDVLGVIEDVLDLFAVQAWERGIRLGVAVAEDVPERALGDPIRVRQVLVNLVGNAMKYTEQGGVIVEVAQNWPEGTGEIEGEGARASALAARLQFRVRDTGPGIPPDLLEKLFVPFWQVDVERATRVGGSGLGLALSRNLARRMNGDVVATSEVGKGSVFTFTGQIPKIKSNSWRGRAPRARMLLVEERDAVDIPLTFVAMAQRIGVAVEVVRGIPEVSGDEPPAARDLDLLAVWVRAIEHLPSDDIQARIRALRRHAPTAPVLLVTSIADRTIAPGAQELGFDHVVFEPVRRSGIRAILRLSSHIEQSHPGTVIPTPTPLHPRVAPVGVLVVDDNPVNRKVAALMCQRLGHRVDVVPSGEAAVEAVCAEPGKWDVVLMDVMMPGISGIEAARRIQESVAPPPTIFALSASDDAAQRQECDQAGMVAHLKKPLTVDDLRRALADHLSPPAEDRRDTLAGGGGDDGEERGVVGGDGPVDGV